MPYLHCPGCRRTAWLTTGAERAVGCRYCGATVDPVVSERSRALARAVRERFARDSRLHSGPPRFVRDSGPHRVAE
jgi:hypothetical protein